MKELIQIQQTLNAPKDKRNNFGNYNYRSAEGIIEAVKPILSDLMCTLVLTDECMEIAGKPYIKATAMITNSDGESVWAVGYAREELEKKGMDASQMTGAASSYARKYAMNGLFAIDDSKDADTDEYRRETDAAKTNAQPQESASKKDDDNKQWWSSLDDATKQKVLARAIEQGMEAKQLRDYYKISKADFETIKNTLGK